MNWKVLFPGSYAGADMASGDDCTWTTTSVRTVNESPEAKLKRLESEQRRVADELGAVRKQIEDAKKPPKTRGEEVAEKMVIDNPVYEELSLYEVDHATGCVLNFKTGGDQEGSKQVARAAIARAIDAERAAAKAEQREADALLAAHHYAVIFPSPNEQRVYAAARQHAAETIRNIK